MGLSSKQVSSDRHGWNQTLLQTSNLELPKPPSLKRQASQIVQQQQQQQSEPLKCPRCDSTNTKFCYYNNYNKSQPRHFCKACKRHWTKGGTLRNVPIGGGRKNKRLKTHNSTTKTTLKTTPTTTTTTTTNDNIKMLVQNQHNTLPLGGSSASLGGFNEKNTLTEAFYQTLVRQTPCSIPETSITFNNKNLNDGIFLGNDLQFPYSNLGNFENNPCSISPSNLYNYTGDQTSGLEETVMNSLDNQQPWKSTTTTQTIQSAITNNVLDMTSNWGWDDFDKFVSVEADLSMPWEDTEIKLPGP